MSILSKKHEMGVFTIICILCALLLIPAICGCAQKGGSTAVVSSPAITGTETPGESSVSASAPSASTSSPAPPKEFKIIPGKSFGTVTLGADIKTAEEIWGSAEKVSGTYRYKEYGITLSVSDNTITAIQVDKDKYLTTAYKTDKGIMVGTPAAAAIMCYGEDYQRADSTDRSYKYNLDYKKLGIEFAISDKEEVSKITIKEPEE